MSERATVDFFKDAKPGDLVWYRDGNREVWGPDGKYAGRGHWSLKPVVEITRKYITIGEPGFLHDFEKDTGHARCVRGYAPPDHIYGELEAWVEQHRHEIHRRTATRDVLTLLIIAAAVGMKPPAALRIEPEDDLVMSR